VANVNVCSEFGVGMAIDIEGNTRFYDLLRFKKMAKISSGQVKLGEGVSGPTKFRLMSNVCIEMT